ncbi:uncharacterized protein LOC113502962 isoform X1 [Trichoplusia ni]|uniref:Uncharacterized protein LOC113502962 isoform X1 n=1 Tax=Trichoplusia ni TaxID=7111 RepID=A0A7E5WK80_TRINI|nr:uncharacterized protein LOC113502962 isoform X1 [Trichoplusia ni]
MEDIHANQAEIFEAMTKLSANIKKDSFSRKVGDYFKRRLETLESYWAEFQYNHDRLCTEESRSHPYFLNNEYERAAELYRSVKALINQQQGLTKAGQSVVSDQEEKLQQREGQPSGTSLTSMRDEQASRRSSPERSSRGSSSKTDDMLKKQSSNIKAFQRTVASFNLDEISEKWEMEDALKTLQSRWSVIDTLHWELDGELEEMDEQYEQAYAKQEKIYNDLKKAINSKLWSVAHKVRSTPKLDIPIFNGSYQQWTSFKDLFTETIHNNYSLSNAQKMQHLKSKLRGEPEKLIQHLPISSDNYNVSWDILNHRYNNLKLICSSHLDTLLNITAVQHATINHIKRLHDTTVESLNAIKNLGVDISSWDPLLVHILSPKLDSETYDDYAASIKDPRALPKLQDFLSFLEGKFTAMESSRRKQENHSNKLNNAGNFKQSSFGTKHSRKNFNLQQSFTAHGEVISQPTNNKNANSKKYYMCPICKTNEHGIYYCQQFLEMSPQIRRKTLSKLDLCQNCLYCHYGNACISSKRCRECNGNHNTLIHAAFTQSSHTSVASTAKATENTTHATKTETPQLARGNSHVSLQQNMPDVVLPTAMIKVQTEDGSFQILRALLDQGSQTSLISENAAQLLGIPRKKCPGVIWGVGEKETNCKGVMSIKCASINNNFEFEVDVYIMNKLVKNLPNRTFQRPTWSYLDNITLADPDFNISRSVDLLLGSRVYSKLLLEGVCRETEDSASAQNTRLGWILSGDIIQSFQCNIILHNLDEIQQFWEIEDITDQTSLSSGDQQAIDYYQKTTIRQEDGRYQVRLPLKPNFTDMLGSSKPKAIAQFKSLERKFKQHPNIQEEYQKFMTEYQELGHMKLASNSLKPDCFLTHHSVLRPDSTTTKFRVVFNASAKTSTGNSLNDVMEAGPNLQQDLQSLIIKWRQYKFAYTADIEKMFRQIWVHEDDQRYQKIVWRNSLSDPNHHNNPIQEYQLTTVTYGTKAAPFLSLMTLKQLAQDERVNYTNSLATDVLENSFYVDDLLHGSHSPESAKLLTRDLINLLKSGGFNLRKWKSNVPELLKHIQTDNNTQDTFNFKQLEQTKTLGLIWDPKEDTFRFELKIELTKTPVTKRSLLSDISKLFDPLGWLSPLSTRLKIIFQNVWLRNIKWDDPLPEDIRTEWVSVKNNIHRVNQLQVPRWIGTRERDSIELHGFCDASQKAYACVIYCRIKGNEQSTPVLLVGKTRLVPTSKSVSLPRLELSGALLLSKLMLKVQQCLSNYDLNIYGWVDSMVVLGWLNGDPTRWKSFVANRVRQITTIMPVDCWRYVKSSENPADCASRGLNAGQLEAHSLWWKGPSWLSTYDAEKESKLLTFTTDEEIKNNNKLQVNVTQQNNDCSVISYLVSKYSSFTRLINVYAMILRYFKRLRLKQKAQSRHLTLQEIRHAKSKLIKYVQETDFLEEIHNLQQGKPISSKSKLLNLNPFLDQDGILRVGGRLKHANIDPQMKHPIILSKNSRLTELIIDQSHILTYHGGPQLTSAFIRQKYWIVGGIRAVKFQLRRCVKCRRHNPSNQHQIMGDLPPERTNPSRPFQNVGVDYTGHVFIKANKGRGIKTTKGYVAVFICMATKAVHLELVSDLTASSFIAALRRMIARRGLPSNIYSDQGTNFIGANKVLQEEYKEILSTFDQEFQTEILTMGIEWHFNAPSWPSAGGLWEAAVKSLKYHLKRVVGEQKLTFEEFSTLLYQLEACMNSRPLCPLTEDSADLNYLTPAHFLSSGPNLTLYETETDLRTRWNLSQRIYQDIWKRWRGEYLTQLNTRSKWRRPQENIKVGDLVLIHDANLPPGKWAMGRVTQVHPGSDGYVRVVTLKTKNGFMQRPIVKLTPLLECSNEEDKQVSPSDQQDTTTSPQLNQTRRGKRLSYSYTTLMSLLLLVLSLVCNVQGAYNITQLQGTQAIYFDKISEMNLIQDQWKIVVYYDMQPYWRGSNIFNVYMKHLENLCTQTERRSHCDVIMLQLRHRFMELEYYDRMLLNQHFEAHTRTRRGLINGIGYVANSLFGVLDEHFAEQYQRDITLVRQNQKHLASLWRNQTSIIEAENNLLKRVESTMEKQHKIFNQHLINLDQAVTKLKNEVEKVAVTEDFILSTLIANNILSSLKNIQDSLLDTITNVQHFNVHLITPAQLQDELNIISNQLPKELSLPINSIVTDLYKIYQIMQVRARMTREYFIFEIQIPLENRESYDIYHMIPIQHQVKDGMVNVVLISEYIAINIRKDTYLPISGYELQKCIRLNANTNLCQLQKPIYQRDSDQNFCIRNQEGNTCTTVTTTCKTTWTELNVINTFIITCCGHCTLRIICGDQVTTEQVTGVNIIALGNNCVIKGETFIITSHKQQTIDMKVKPDVIAVEIAPVNNIINLSLPINEYKQESYQTSLQNISKQIELMKAASEQVNVDEGVSYHDVHHYVAIYFVGAAGLAFAAFAYVRSRRRRTVQLALTPAQPSVHYRASASDLSARGMPNQSDQCASEVFRSDQCASVTNISSACVTDKATSPIIRKCSFKTSSNNLAI